jgi:hypothetical protein
MSKRLRISSNAGGPLGAQTALLGDEKPPEIRQEDLAVELQEDRVQLLVALELGHGGSGGPQVEEVLEPSRTRSLSTVATRVPCERLDPWCPQGAGDSVGQEEA